MKIRYINGLEEGRFYFLNFIVEQITKEEAENLPKVISDNIIKFLGEKIRYLERLDSEEEKEAESLGIIPIDLDCNIRLYIDPQGYLGLKLPKHGKVFNLIQTKERKIIEKLKDKEKKEKTEIDRKEIHQQAIKEGLKEISEIILESLT